MTINLRLGDCLVEMPKLADASIDAIITDPPYFIPAKHYATRKNFRRNFADLGILESFFKAWFEQVERILKPMGHLYMFCDGQSYPLFFYYSYFFTKSVRPLIWDKGTSINGFSWRHQHELILFGEMPNAVRVETGDGDVIRCRAVPVNDREHPAEKPIELGERLSAKCGSVILDPFMGSGALLQGAIKQGKSIIGCELDVGYFAIAQRRIAEAQAQMRMELA